MRMANPDRPLEEERGKNSVLTRWEDIKGSLWMGVERMKVENVPDPKILNPRDTIVRITRTRICGPTCTSMTATSPRCSRATSSATSSWERSWKRPGVKNEKLKVGDKVVVPFTIACGQMLLLPSSSYGRCCDNSNPNYWIAETMMGYSPSGLFGYTHMTGGYAGGQAQYARVPFADVGPFKIPDGIPDEKVLFLSDIFPTGYMGAENCNIEPEIRSRSGDADPWVSSPFAVRTCWGRSGSS